jgi:hypothetical protein
MKRAKIGGVENQVIINESEMVEGSFEVTVYNDGNSNFLTAIISRDELIKLIGQLEVITDLV